MEPPSRGGGTPRRREVIIKNGEWWGFGAKPRRDFVPYGHKARSRDPPTTKEGMLGAMLEGMLGVSPPYDEGGNAWSNAWRNGGGNA